MGTTKQTVKEHGADMLKKDVAVKKLGLLDFSGAGNMSPEAIDDAINSTSSFYKAVDIADIAKRIKNNKAKYNGARRS